MDLKKMCRLCFFALRRSRNIFKTPGLLDKISRFTDVKIRQEDGLPTRICDSCYIKLRISDKFRRQVGKTDKLIRACALEQTAKSNQSQRSSLERETLAYNAVPKWLESGFRPESNRRAGIRRERIRLSKGRKTRNAKFPQNVELGIKDSERSLIYSYATVRSLVASYESLINRCREQGFLEEFSLPSSFVSSENESADERTAHLIAVRQRLNEKRKMQKYFSSKNSVKNFTKIVADHGSPDLINPRVPADPLNLLKVKSVRPILTEDSSSTEESFIGGINTSISAFWRRDYPRRKARGRRRFIVEDREDNSSTECSPLDSDFSGKLSRSSLSHRSGSTIKSIMRQRSSRGRDSNPSSPVAAAMIDETIDTVAPEKKQSPAQCPVCDKICATVHGLKVHFHVHRSTSCPICDAATETKDKFRDHIMAVHFKPLDYDSLFKCNICRSIFKTDIGLNAHMRVHSKSVPAIRSCPHCNRVFTTIRGFNIHLAKSHSGFRTG